MRSSMKENQSSHSMYYDITSPISNLEKITQKTIFKNNVNNSFDDKVNFYKRQSRKNSLYSQNLIELKASSVVYKIPEFSSPQVNYEVSDAVRKKVDQIKNDMITHLPVISKSSNYNPKKIENTLSHRSNVMELQQWLKKKLKNPPKTVQESIQYKNMIMGIGMKDLIRMINQRCLDEGKMVEQIWELTWSICRQIIIYLSKRAKKCEEILETQIISFNDNYKSNFSSLESQLLEAREELKRYSLKEQQLQTRINFLQQQNHKLQMENGRQGLDNNYFNEQFLNVLQQNLAMYLHLGDKSKKQWIRKMYKQVQRAKQSIRKQLKQRINKAFQNRFKQERMYSDNVENALIKDEEGNYLLQAKQKESNVQGTNEQGNEQGNQQGMQDIEDSEGDDYSDNNCENLKEQLFQEFLSRDMEAQTYETETFEQEIQCDAVTFSEMFTETERICFESSEMNTETIFSDVIEIESKSIEKPKIQKRLPNHAKLASKSPKNQRNLSQQISTDFSAEKVNSESLRQQIELIKNLGQDQRQARCSSIQFVCKQCGAKNLSSPFSQSELDSGDSQHLKKDSSSSDRNVNSDKNFKKIRQTNSKKSKDSSIFSHKKGSDFEGKDGHQSNYNHVQRNRSKIYNSLEYQTIQELDHESQLQRFQNEAYKPFKHDQNSASESPDHAHGRLKKSDSNYSLKRRAHKKQSSILHDIGFKKEIELLANLKQVTEINEEQQSEELAKLPLHNKQPYFKFFTEQITEANKNFIAEINFQQVTSDHVLNNYFNMVQDVNLIPEHKILINQKQMLATIEKNLMPIILELLSVVKKSILKKTVDQTMKTFYSLPYILMNKFSTKYGVKILATKNMKLLLSSLKKIETISDRYKSLRLMLFTDCRAYYSQDLFVYLYILATITPHLDVEKTISCEEVIQIREICEKYLTKEKSIYEQFDAMTKQQFGFNKTHSQLGGLKLAPLIRSILTNYRMMKINRIQEVGFVFLMLKKENYVEYQKFSYFISSLKLQTELKVKIVKLFLANCDLKTKNKKIAISESGFSRFLIQCPQFTFDLLSNIIEDQNISLKDLQHNSIQNDSPLASKRMSLQPSIQHLKSIHDIKSRISLNVDSAAFQNVVTASHNRLSTQKSILQTYQKESTKINDQKQKKAEKTSQLQSLSNLQNPSVLPKKIREYSYFTYQIAKFLQNEDETKYMTNKQKQFIQKYLIGHVMHCEIDQIVGIIDYFSNDMLEIICCEQKYLSIKEKTNDALNHARNSMFE